MKQELSPEELALIDVVKADWLALLDSKPQINKTIAERVITKVYEIAGYQKPNFTYCESLTHAMAVINHKLGNIEPSKRETFSTDFYTSVYSSGFYAFYDYFTRIGTINNTEFNILKEIKNSGLWANITFDTDSFIVPYPEVIALNAAGELHNTRGSAISFKYSPEVAEFMHKDMILRGLKSEGDPVDMYDNFYFINGRQMPARIFEKPFTAEDFINEEDSDVKAGMYEIMESRGEGTMLEFLGAECVDTQEVEHEVELFDGEGSNAKLIGTKKETELMQLFKTKQKFAEEEDLNGKSPARLVWLKLTCPSTGTNYLIPSDDSFDKAVDAAKYHRPRYVPNNIPYNWSQRN